MITKNTQICSWNRCCLSLLNVATVMSILLLFTGYSKLKYKPLTIYASNEQQFNTSSEQLRIYNKINDSLQFSEANQALLIKDNDLLRYGNNIKEEAPEKFDQSNEFEIINTCSDPNVGPKKSIFLLKVHKTGSTTMRNILQRYALKNRLSIPITRYQHTYPSKSITRYIVPLDSYLQEFKKHTQARKKTSASVMHTQKRVSITRHIHHKKSDIFARHSVFNKDEALKVMSPNVTFITTLRHPLHQMISAFGQWNLSKAYGLLEFDDPIEVFLRNPEAYDKILPASFYNQIAKIENINLSFTKHYVSYQFGFDLGKENDTKYIHSYLQYLNNTLKVAILTDRFPESLILLKRELCWSFQDLIFMQLRNRHRSSKVYADDLMENHRRWTKLDYKIYDMFLERHENLVKQGGKLFDDEVKAFNSVLDQVTSFCTRVSEAVNQTDPFTWFQLPTLETIITKTNFNEEFKISGIDCIIMTMNEKQLWLALMIRTFPELCNAKFTDFIQSKFMDLRWIKNGLQCQFCQNDMPLMGYNLPYTLIKYAFFET